METHGFDRLGKPGQLIIANHPGFLDIVFLLAMVRDANCIISGSLVSNPFIALQIRGAGYVVNDSAEAMIADSVAALKAGETLIIFPEGTRTQVGQLPVLQRGASNIAVKGAASLTPVIISCDPPALTKTHPWYRIAHKKSHFAFRVLDDIDLRSYAATPPPVASRRLNEQLQEFFRKETPIHERADDRGEAPVDRMSES